MGRDVQLVGLGQVGHLLRGREALPLDVHLHHVHRVQLEVRPVLAHGLQLLARADRRAHRRLELRQRVRVLIVDLEPEEVVGLERPAHADRLARLEVHVDVQADADLRTDGVAHGGDLRDRLLHDVARRDLVVRAESALRDRARRTDHPVAQLDGDSLRAERMTA